MTNKRAINVQQIIDDAIRADWYSWAEQSFVTYWLDNKGSMPDLNQLLIQDTGHVHYRGQYVGHLRYTWQDTDWLDEPEMLDETAQCARA